MIKSATEVIDFVVLSDDFYKVSHKYGKDSTFNLAIKIVHLGHSYKIPTSDCGDWMSYFIMCPCIIRALIIGVRYVENVKTLILFTSHRFTTCVSWRVSNLTWRATMTFPISLIHNIYQLIKSVAPLAVRVMWVGK